MPFSHRTDGAMRSRRFGASTELIRFEAGLAMTHVLATHDLL
jgi:hypothetical protein